MAPVEPPSESETWNGNNPRVLSLSSSNGVPHTESETSSFLHSMFPRLKQAYIDAVVKSENGDIGKALEDLLKRFALEEAEDLENSTTVSTSTSETGNSLDSTTEDDIYEDADDSEESGEDEFEDASSDFPELQGRQTGTKQVEPTVVSRRRPKPEPEPEDPLAFGEKLAILRDLFPDHSESERTSVLVKSNQVLAEAVDKLVSADHPKVFHMHEGDVPMPHPSGKKRTTKITLSLGEYYAQDEYWEPADSEAPLPLPKTSTVLDMATMTKFAQLKEMFVEVSELEIMDIFSEQEFKMDATVKALHLKGHESRALKNQHGGVISGPHYDESRETYRVYQGHGSSQSWATRAVARPVSAKSPSAEVSVSHASTSVKSTKQAPSCSSSYTSSTFRTQFFFPLMNFPIDTSPALQMCFIFGAPVRIFPPWAAT
jgi:hypothetical protein